MPPAGGRPWRTNPKKPVLPPSLPRAPPCESSSSWTCLDAGWLPWGPRSQAALSFICWSNTQGGTGCQLGLSLQNLKTVVPGRGREPEGQEAHLLTQKCSLGEPLKSSRHLSSDSPAVPGWRVEERSLVFRKPPGTALRWRSTGRLSH